MSERPKVLAENAMASGQSGGYSERSARILPPVLLPLVVIMLSLVVWHASYGSLIAICSQRQSKCCEASGNSRRRACS